MDLIIVPGLSPERIARSLGSLSIQADTVLVLFFPTEHAGATALRFVTPGGEPATVPHGDLAQTLSRGGFAVGHATTEPERFRLYVDGAMTADLSSDDALYVPLDADGDPDFDAEPTAVRDGGDTSGHRVRSCLDLGMDKGFSCRFGPVLSALRAAQGRAYVVVRDGRALVPPAQVSWPASRGDGAGSA